MIFSDQRLGMREGGMTILLIALCILVVIWIVVLWGSRYFGSRDA